MNAMRGWIKSYRAMFENAVVCRDSDHYAVWGFLLHHAVQEDVEAWFRGQPTTLVAGQLITTRKAIAGKFGIDATKVYRILKTFESERQISVESSNKESLITVLNWEIYQLKSGDFMNKSTRQPLSLTTHSKSEFCEVQLLNSEQQTNNKNEKSEQQDVLVDVCSSMCCEDEEEKVNNKTGKSEQQESSKSQKSEQQISPLYIDNIYIENKEREKYIARARDEILEIAEVKKILMTSEIWLEQASMALRKTKEETLHSVEQFFNEKIACGETSKSVQDAKAHFINWMKFQKQTGHGKRQEKNDGGRGEVPQRLRKSDFD